MVHIEGYDGGSANRRETDDMRSVSAPNKVIRPMLIARMVQGNGVTVIGIESIDTSMLAAVAR